MHIESGSWLIGGLVVLGQAIRRLYRMAKTTEDTNRIVRHIYENHLPHIDRALRAVCAQLGVEYEETPPPPLG